MEQPQNALKVVEVCLVQPPQGTTTSLPLTFFDILWLRFPPVERLFFYEFPHPPSSFFDSLLPTLKHSLQLTLQHFLPLAGNITWPLDSPHPIITYVPSDAVSFTIAESNTNNFNILCSNTCKALERYPLIPRLNITQEQASVIALQITLFPNSGFCIGITTHHAAMDGSSSTLFMKAWAYACSKLIINSSTSSSSLSLPQHLTPFFDRSVIGDSTRNREVYVEELLKQGGTTSNNRSLKVWGSNNTAEADLIKGLFELTPSHILKLKQYAQIKMKTKVHLSTFSVTCAFVLTCLIKAENTIEVDNKVVFIITVDCRSRLDPPIVQTYFGNCVAGQLVPVEVSKLLGKDGFIIALEGIIEGLKRVENGVLCGAETWMSRMKTFKDIKIFSVAGSPRFEVYNVDFGWGKPKKVDMTSIDKTKAFSVSECKTNSKGIEIGLTLNKLEMEAFARCFTQTLESFECFETVE
ncbi:hypothetical protein RIF29_18932 [Crotalaria pallida]|uniref:Uncharacterized protein n=1 Tax=Crotalaria pallida TaxID=3830 RepID=A0AAN9I606_CROPI